MSRVEDFCRSLHKNNASFVCAFLSSGGVSLCAQHRGPWDILYRLLRVSINFITCLSEVHTRLSRYTVYEIKIKGTLHAFVACMYIGLHTVSE